MIEYQALELYRKMKKRLLESVKNDEIYRDFISYLTTGEREYSLHNSTITKTIDKEWVEAIEEWIPAMETLVNKPRSYIKREDSVVPVELARKIGAQSVKHLASNTKYISRIENDTVIPSKILTMYNEETFDIYENRFIMTLLDRVALFVDRRFVLVGQKGGDEFTSELIANGAFSHDDENSEFEIRLKVHQGAEYLGGRGVALELFERIKTIRQYILSFKQTQFYKAMVQMPRLKPPIMMTNMISKEPNYKACYGLWKFMDGYDKVGYTEETSEKDERLSDEYSAEIDAFMLMQYLILKNEMQRFEDTVVDANTRKHRLIKGKFVRRDTSLEKIHVQDPSQKLSVNLDGSNEQEVNKKVSQAISRVLTKLNRQRKEEAEERRKLERAQEKLIASAIRSALGAEDLNKKQKRIEEKANDRSVGNLLQNLLAEEKRKQKEAQKQRAEQERELRIKDIIEKALISAKNDVSNAEDEDYNLQLPNDRLLRKEKKKRIAKLVDELASEEKLIAKRKEVQDEPSESDIFEDSLDITEIANNEIDEVLDIEISEETDLDIADLNIIETTQVDSLDALDEEEEDIEISEIESEEVVDNVHISDMEEEDELEIVDADSDITFIAEEEEPIASDVHIDAQNEVPLPAKKKKKGFFSRLFGKK